MKLVIFFTKSLPKPRYAVSMTYLPTVLIPECFAADKCQYISLTILYARGESLYTNGTKNVLEQSDLS